MDRSTITLLNKILDLYMTYDLNYEQKHEEPKEGVFNYITSTATSVANFVTGQGAVTQTLLEICLQVRKDINIENQTGEDWLNICIALAKKAEQAQDLVKISRRSRCHEILHCIRNAIITTMKNDTSYGYKDIYDHRIKTLKNQLEKRESELDEKLDSKEHLSETEVAFAKMQNEEIKKITLDLTYLECRSAVNKAVRNNFIPKLIMCKERHKLLKLPQPIDYTYEELYPYVLQSFLYIHFKNHYQPYIQKSFREFCEGCNEPDKNNTHEKNVMQVFVNAYPEKVNPVSNLMSLGFYKSSPNQTATKPEQAKEQKRPQ